MAEQTRIQKKNRDIIRKAALKVFASYGFRGATLDQIATEAGLSKPNLLYYFSSKEAIYEDLLSDLLGTWLDPLRRIDPEGEPKAEIMTYLRAKLSMSQDYPRESRLFANEILQGAPRMADRLTGELRELVDIKAQIIRDWVAAGKIRPVDPYHLIFSIWSLTQHYADFDVQVRAVLGDSKDPFEGASQYLETLFDRLLDV